MTFIRETIDEKSTKMSYNIIVDLSHNERIEEFPDFALDEDDFEIDYIDKNEGPIEFDLLEDYDILFIGDIQHKQNNPEDKFTKQELLAIKKFVGDKSIILQAAHPSNRNIKGGFFGCGIFLKVNEHLTKMGETSINWNLSNIS